jgi:hypothetical protein
MYGVVRLRERIAAKKGGNFVIIENLEARGSFPKIEFGSRGSYPRLQDYIAKPFAKSEDFIIPKSFETTNDFSKTEARENFAKSDKCSTSYGSMNAVHPVVYPAVTVVGSGAR